MELKKFLILENNRGEKEIHHRVTLYAIQEKLADRGINLEKVHAQEDVHSEYYGDPNNDTIFSGRAVRSGVDWHICLRTVYVPPEYGKDFFTETLNRVIASYDPNRILSHLALYGRGNMFSEYPAVKCLMKFAANKHVVIYTGTADDQESMIADTGGLIEYRYNRREIDTQISIILNELDRVD